MRPVWLAGVTGDRWRGRPPANAVDGQGTAFNPLHSVLPSLDHLLRFSLPSAPRSPGWLDRALALTQRYGVTFHDAAYHAHAIVERGVFVTADERYVERTSEAGAVTRLSEWG